MERDVFVEEIAKLQKDVKRLKSLNSQLCCENKELCRIRDRAGDLELVNHHLENCMDVSASLFLAQKEPLAVFQVVSRALESANRDVVTYRQRVTETSLNARRNAKRCKDLQDQIALMKDCLHKERHDRKNLEATRVCLEAELIKVEQKIRANGGSVSSPGSPKSSSPRSARTI
ncbi:uncharacterized protein LOC9643366 [Selaginella moellendorffii]|uniref:uncharacterized protein LOC9643366 n=1 Tax=Selaginella moellendorffii TaxID=88036 RepID=UPI000D1C2D0D|nr:uncharacterized protein LOC9643366 [Selaginella moellendorffii]|eukprot:XP_024522273.1 uncharacterized protein LOC9643366 [Selaginella moellendorffii]